MLVMKSLLTVFAVLICMSAKSQITINPATHSQIATAIVSANSDTLTVPAGSPIHVIKVGDTYYEISKPELKKVEPVSIPSWLNSLPKSDYMPLLLTSPTGGCAGCTLINTGGSYQLAR